MKKLLFLTMAALLATACQKKADTTNALTTENTTQDPSSGESTSPANSLDAPAGAPIEVSFTGGIDPKNYTPEQEATVSINRFPNNLNEWKELQKQIGNRPEGAVMLQLAAFELYYRHTEAGTEAIKLGNVESNVNSVLRIICDKFGKTQYNDQFMPYLIGSFLEGAEPTNAYNPNKPYTIRVRTHPAHDYERSEMLKGYVLYLQVYSSGYDTPWRGCDVIKQKGNEFYTVNNCPSMYTGCKDIDFECDDEYHGLD
ncbi:MAG: hypothetical protein KBT12_07950 [Bacteroidales bacterium]|nr:hypothetical protein [Candidatus Physcousia equi]